MKHILTILIMISYLYAEELTPLHIAPDKSLRGTFQLNDVTFSVDSNITWINPDLEKKSIQIIENRFTLPKKQKAFYHLFRFDQVVQNSSYTAKYFHKQFGKPSQKSPEKVASFYEGGFEFIPLPLPMEHGSYYSSDEYKFKLLFNNKPLKNSVIKLMTHNGTNQSYKTDDEGFTYVTLPNDFTEVKPGLRSNRPSYFILSAHMVHNSKNYHTTLCQAYHVNPIDHWRSIPYAIVVLILGSLLGIFIYRRFKNG